MEKRTRIINAINHIESDITPYNIEFTVEELDKMIEYSGDKDFYNHIGNHIVAAGYEKWTEIKPGYWKDMFGTVWNRTVDKSIGVVEFPLIPDIEDYSYDFPDIDEKQIRKNIENIAGDTGRFRIFNLGFSMFERAWALCGMENLLMAMLTSPNDVHKLLNDICGFNLKILKIVCESKEIDAVLFGDDWGQQKGMIMGPSYWRGFIKPYVARMYAVVKESGKFICQHSCGDITEIFPDLIEMGLNVYQTFQPEIYDLTEFKQKFGRSLTVWGGVSTQHVLAHGTPGEVRRETTKLIRILGSGGGLIAAPTHSVPGDVSAENLMAMLEVFTNQDKFIKKA